MNKKTQIDFMKNDYSIWTYIFLCFITLNIYHFFCMYHIIKDVNIACKSDGKPDINYLKCLFLSVITLGVYNFFWIPGLVERIHNAIREKHREIEISASKAVTYMIISYFIWGIFMFITYNMIFVGMNALADDYNTEQRRKRYYENITA